MDEIVVVDTGSTDASMDIARAHGARLIEWRWCDDFAAARNIGLDAASGDWILYIDADERLAEGSHAQLREGLADPSVFAARVWFRPRQGWTAYREYRLFRNDARLRFKGAMHETIRPDLDVLLATAGARVIEVPALIVHFGYDGEMAGKHARNLPLLRRAVEANPDRLYYWNDLAHTLAALGQVEDAIAVSAEGLRRGRGRDDLESRIVRSMLAQASIQLRLRRGGDLVGEIAAGLALFPGNWSLRFLYARALIDAGDFGQALAQLELLMAQDGDSLRDEHLAHDKRIFGCQAHELAGVAWLRLGDRKAAAAAFRRAAALAPDDPSYRIKAMALDPNPHFQRPGSAA